MDHGSLILWWFNAHTPKSNIDTKNDGFEKNVSPFKYGYFGYPCISMLVFGGVYLLTQNTKKMMVWEWPPFYLFHQFTSNLTIIALQGTRGFPARMAPRGTLRGQIDQPWCHDSQGIEDDDCKLLVSQTVFQQLGECRMHKHFTRQCHFECFVLPIKFYCIYIYYTLTLYILLLCYIIYRLPTISLQIFSPILTKSFYYNFTILYYGSVLLPQYTPEKLNG